MNEKKQKINELIQTKYALKDFCPEFLGISYKGYNERWRVNSWTDIQIRNLNRVLASEFNGNALTAMICPQCKGWLYTEMYMVKESVIETELVQCDCEVNK